MWPYKGYMRDPCGNGNVLYLDYRCEYAVILYCSFTGCYIGGNWVRGIWEFCVTSYNYT